MINFFDFFLQPLFYLINEYWTSNTNLINQNNTENLANSLDSLSTISDRGSSTITQGSDATIKDVQLPESNSDSSNTESSNSNIKFILATVFLTSLLLGSYGVSLYLNYDNLIYTITINHILTKTTINANSSTIFNIAEFHWLVKYHGFTPWFVFSKITYDDMYFVFVQSLQWYIENLKGNKAYPKITSYIMSSGNDLSKIRFFGFIDTTEPINEFNLGIPKITTTYQPLGGHYNDDYINIVRKDVYNLVNLTKWHTEFSYNMLLFPVVLGISLVGVGLYIYSL